MAPLVRLFVRLETVAIRAELERPARPAVESGAAVSVARAHSERFKTLRAVDAAERAEAAAALAQSIHHKLVEHLTNVGGELKEVFQDIDPRARRSVDRAAPPDERAMHWKRQIIRAAQQVGFYANLSQGSWWVRLHVTVLGETLRYIAAVQKVGQGETGFLAFTVYAEVLHPKTDDEEPAFPEPLLELKPTDSVTLAYKNEAEERWLAVEEVLDRTLAAAVDVFAQRLG